MVARRSDRPSGDGDNSGYYEQLQESWPAERPSRKKRAYLRKHDRRVEVHATRRDEPTPARISKALLAAQRDLARLQAEADARRQDGTEDHQ